MQTDDIKSRIRGRLEFLYGADNAPEVYESVMRLVARYGGQGQDNEPRERWDERDVVLISYGDSVLDEGLSPLSALEKFLSLDVGGLVSFVHLLPFYPYSSDDGFAVIDFRRVNPELGDWEDIERLSCRYRMVFDAVINHVSRESVYMKGYAAGEEEYADFFIALPPDTDTRCVLRTRNLPLLHDYPTHEGTKWLWTTFSRDQIDLNYANPKVLLEVLDVLLTYSRRGASMIRLDAIPYLWKRLGTSCAHLDETHAVIKLIRDVYDMVSPPVLLLTETNVPHDENMSYFGDRGDEAQVIYNFALPPLILHALVTGDGSALSKWAKCVSNAGERATYLNITATHDGIGMRPTEGILDEGARRRLCELAVAHGGAVTGRRNADGSVSPYELNLNYFDAVNDPRSDEPREIQVARFMCSQAITLSFIGIPGIYIHSLVGSRNDTEGARESGMARRINRARLRLGELRDEIGDRASLRALVFREYKRMLQVRRREKAFHPNADQTVLDMGREIFAAKRTCRESGDAIVALHNLTRHEVSADVSGFFSGGPVQDLLGGRGDFSGRLMPYQVSWLTAL